MLNILSNLLHRPRQPIVPPTIELSAVPQKFPFNPALWFAENAARDFPELETAYQQNQRLQLGYSSFKQFHADATNCYMYALGDRGLLLARLCANVRLGTISGRFLKSEEITEKNALRLIEQEGLIATGEELETRQGFRIAALFVCQERDYHFARLDNEGWTHKFPRSSPKILVHNNGDLVVDPCHVSISRFYHTVVENPERQNLFEHYNFVSFVAIPNDLSISTDTIQWHRRMVAEEFPHLSQGWDLYLEKMGIPASGSIPIPQYG